LIISLSIMVVFLKAGGAVAVVVTVLVTVVVSVTIMVSVTTSVDVTCSVSVITLVCVMGIVTVWKIVDAAGLVIVVKTSLVLVVVTVLVAWEITAIFMAARPKTRRIKTTMTQKRVLSCLVALLEDDPSDIRYKQYNGI